MGFAGYRRPDGRFGTRNHVLVISSVSCANGVVAALGRALPEIKPILHSEGCGRGPQDMARIGRTLIGLGKNPNAAAVLVIGLGCEFTKPDFLANEIAESGKPVEHLLIQEEGGSRKTVTRAMPIARRLVREAARVEREECGWDGLVVGLECGGSDALSGRTANPAVGRFADWLVEQGGTVILSETTEMIGTEDILVRQAATPEIGERVRKLITDQQQLAEQVLGPLAAMAISPGNQEGGLSSLEEKARGCVVKAGSSPIREVLDYAEAPGERGLVLMDTPGSDIFSLTGMAAGGAQLMIFTTGRGTPAGFPGVPVIKVSSNTELFERMRDDMDLDAGPIASGGSVEQVGQELIDLTGRVASGQETAAERNLQDILAIHTTGPAF